MAPGRSRGMRFGVAALATLTAAALTTACNRDEAGKAGAFPSRNVEIMVPAAPGGGWDITARSMQKVLRDDKIVNKPVQVYNVPGSGGTIGLSQLVSKEKGDPHKLMMCGLVMVGAIETSKAKTDLTKVTPIATLTAEAEAIVVPAKSKYQNLTQLVDDLKKNPKSVAWGGGSVGGSDHIVAGLIAKAAGVNPAQIKYVGYSGGGEATAAILSGNVTAGISGVSEFEDQIKAGKMRLLAVTSPKSIDVAGKPAPTIKDAGLDVELMNWRAIVAPPGISDGERDDVVAVIDKLHESDGWKKTLEDRGWDDFYKTGDDAKKFIADETTRIKALIKELGTA
jgi:putative tricarboxylic transport membrane protein